MQRIVPSAAIYARVDAQDAATLKQLREQIEACREVAQGRGYQVVKEIAEVAPGGEERRPRLEELRLMVQSGQLDAVLCYGAGVLSESPEQRHFLQEEMTQNRVSLLFVMENG
jgi:DNA invertase Pin-like site-specific DNA recombinase